MHAQAASRKLLLREDPIPLFYRAACGLRLAVAKTGRRRGPGRPKSCSCATKLDTPSTRKGRQAARRPQRLACRSLAEWVARDEERPAEPADDVRDRWKRSDDSVSEHRRAAAARRACSANARRRHRGAGPSARGALQLRRAMRRSGFTETGRPERPAASRPPRDW